METYTHKNTKEMSNQEVMRLIDNHIARLVKIENEERARRKEPRKNIFQRFCDLVTRICGYGI